MQSEAAVARIRAFFKLPNDLSDIISINTYLTHNPVLIPNPQNIINVYHRYPNFILGSHIYPEHDLSKRNALPNKNNDDIFVSKDNNIAPMYDRCNQDNHTVESGISLFVPLSDQGDEFFTYARQCLALEERDIHCCVTSNPGTADVEGLHLYCDRIIRASEPFALHILVTNSKPISLDALNTIACCTSGNWIPCNNMRGTGEFIEFPDFDHDPYLEGAIYLLETVIVESDSDNSRFMASMFQYILAKEQDKFISEPTKIVSLSDGLVGQLLLLGSQLRTDKKQERNPFTEIYITELLERAKECVFPSAILVVRDDCNRETGNESVVASNNRFGLPKNPNYVSNDLFKDIANPILQKAFTSGSTLVVTCTGSLVLKFYDVQPHLVAELQQELNDPEASKLIFSTVESSLDIHCSLSTIAVFVGDNDKPLDHSSSKTFARLIPPLRAPVFIKLFGPFPNLHKKVILNFSNQCKSLMRLFRSENYPEMSFMWRTLREWSPLDMYSIINRKDLSIGREKEEYEWDIRIATHVRNQFVDYFSGQNSTVKVNKGDVTFFVLVTWDYKFDKSLLSLIKNVMRVFGLPVENCRLLHFK